MWVHNSTHYFTKSYFHSCGIKFELLVFMVYVSHCMTHHFMLCFAFVSASITVLAGWWLTPVRALLPRYPMTVPFESVPLRRCNALSFTVYIIWYSLYWCIISRFVTLKCHLDCSRSVFKFWNLYHIRWIYFSYFIYFLFFFFLPYCLSFKLIVVLISSHSTSSGNSALMRSISFLWLHDVTLR